MDDLEKINLELTDAERKKASELIDRFRPLKDESLFANGEFDSLTRMSMFNHRLLSREEETLAYKLKESGDHRGIQILVRYNQRLIGKVVRRFMNNYVSSEDLLMEGNIGLIRAAELFDSSKGFRFTTYAVPWIEQGVRRAIDNYSATVRLPVHIKDLARSIHRVYREVKRTDLTAEEVREKMIEMDFPNVKSIEVIDRCMKYYMQSRDVSLSINPFEDGETTLIDGVSKESDDADESELLHERTLENLQVLVMRALTDREYEVVCLRFGLFGREAMTLEEVGSLFSLTRERIRQIESSALRKLRFKFSAVGLNQENFYQFIQEAKSQEVILS